MPAVVYFGKPSEFVGTAKENVKKCAFRLGVFLAIPFFIVHEVSIPSDTGYSYNGLESLQQEVYMGLYHSLVRYVRDDANTDPFTDAFENPGLSVNGQDIVQYIGFDHPVLAQYFASYIDATNDNGSIVFREISTPRLRVFGNYTDIRSRISDIEVTADEFLSATDHALGD